VIKKDSDWWIGWVEEIPGVNSQGKTKVELLKNLRSALGEALEFNAKTRATRADITRRPRFWCETARTHPPPGRPWLPACSRRGEPFMVGKSGAEPPLGCSAPHGNQPLPCAKNLPGFGK